MADRSVTTQTQTHAAVRLPRAERRAQIVEAAARAFLASGYEKTSMEDVARTAGVTRLILYRIFDSKEALYLAVLTAVLDDMASEFELGPGAIAGERPTVAITLLGIARRHPDSFRLLWRHTSNQPEFQELFVLFRSAATDFASALIAEVSPDPMILQWAAESVVSHVYESICLWLDSGDVVADPQFLRMFGDGMRAMVTAWIEA